jgi:phospholipid-binding lipoprotein MlaA
MEWPHAAAMRALQDRQLRFGNGHSSAPDETRPDATAPQMTPLRLHRVVAASLLALSLGCGAAWAQTNAGADNNDPLESVNRKIFDLNQNADAHFARPVAVFYSRAVPWLVRDGIHNLLVNIHTPVILANDILQGKPQRAVDTIGRIVVNTTVGVGGLVDVAAKTGIPEHSTDFGETLAGYGVDEGPYLVLPILGPSDVRDAAGYGVDIAFDPTTWVAFTSASWFKFGKSVVGVVDTRSRNIGLIDDLEGSSLDVYATERSAYRQHRESVINHGRPDVQDLPDF